ncbi:MAG: hypothetical protein AB1295_04460 [Candidatus Micrarchaeota archaeon]
MRTLMAATLVAVLLFGCLGGVRTGEQAQPSLPGPAVGSTPGVGDIDLSPMEDGPDEMLPDEDIVPPPDTSLEDMPEEGTHADYAALSDELSDMFSDGEEVPDLISEGDIIERP